MSPTGSGTTQTPYTSTDLTVPKSPSYQRSLRDFVIQPKYTCCSFAEMIDAVAFLGKTVVFVSVVTSRVCQECIVPQNPLIQDT